MPDTADSTIVLHWFRRDLRLADNPALTEAARRGRVLPVFIHDGAHPDEVATGAAGRAWLQRSLAALRARLGGDLEILHGDPAALLLKLARQSGAMAVSWNCPPDPSLASRDDRIASFLIAEGLEVWRSNDGLLWHPQDVRKADGSAYQVFTPFYQRGCLAAPSPRRPLPEPPMRVARHITTTSAHSGAGPEPDWARRIMAHWEAGELAAQARLAAFVRDGLSNYATGRDRPALAATSRLSPHLHFGEISPAQVWQAASEAQGAGAAKFRAELGWREFCAHLLALHPDMASLPLRPANAGIRWRDAPAELRAWREGRTGIPFVDAGMRELWQTGWMHNRVRMVAASFLVKNLLIDWRAGEAWFRDCLVDADPASNAAGWQWVAGCGADAAPFFRIFNPVLQGQKHDPDGAYIRRFLPEIARLPDRVIHRPWAASRQVLQDAGVVLGATYPEPIVDPGASRLRALAAFKSRGASSDRAAETPDMFQHERGIIQ